MRIIFLGTPDFAVATLEQLNIDGFDLVAVVTAPDRPAGRGLKMKESAVALAANNLNIPVLKPGNLKDVDFINELESFQADVQVVVAFRMLPAAVWDMPKLGTYNLHASLLPQYRGAAPINHAIINGEKFTGVTTFKLVHEIDMGSIALQTEVPIHDDDTAGHLHDLLMLEGAQLMSETLKRLSEGSLELKEQSDYDQKKLKSAPKLNPEFCSFDNSMTCQQTHNFIRGLSPFPGVKANLIEGGEIKPIKIYKSQISSVSFEAHKQGDLVIQNGHLYICMSDGFLEILELQPAGKRRMTAKDYMNGAQIDSPKRLE